jgi:glycosyltransferase involved in cell wall biosynthesis
MINFNLESLIELESSRDINYRHLMLFELSVGGHYPSYIMHLVQYWCTQNLTGLLTVVVSPQFIEQHADVLESAAGHEDHIRFIPITQAEEDELLPRKSPIHRARRAIQMWNLLCRYAESVNASHCLIMYLDSFQTPLALKAKAPCPVSGIYFRPTFHYGSLTHYRPSLKDKIQQWRERMALPRVLSHPQLQTIFCLDPFVVKPLNNFKSKVKAVHLPDPVQIYNYPEDTVTRLRETLGIQPNRLVFLMFGALDGRKGIHQLLEAILKLPSELGQRLCLLFVGPIKPQDKQQMLDKIPQVYNTDAQIVIHDAFVPDHEIQPFFQLADVILVLYQRHVGMSGVLVRAATASKPVLGSNYGLMGEVTQRHSLGLVLDATMPTEITQGLIQTITTSPAKIGDRGKMEKFAKLNSADHYAKTIFQHI